jgi:hypothetical protein
LGIEATDIPVIGLAIRSVRGTAGFSTGTGICDTLVFGNKLHLAIGNGILRIFYLLAADKIRFTYLSKRKAVHTIERITRRALMLGLTLLEDGHTT